MKNIGLTGSHGTIRKKVACILAGTLDYMYQHDCQSVPNEIWDYWANCSPEYFHSCAVDSFGEYILSAVKLFHPGLMGLDLTDENIIQSTFINMDTMDISYEPAENGLRVDDFIIYFADQTVKQNFGERIWVNLMRQDAQLKSSFSAYKFIIYHDVKTNAEYDFIKEGNGSIIKVVLNGSKKVDGYLKLSRNKFKYQITVSDFVNDKEQFETIAKHILNDERN